MLRRKSLQAEIAVWIFRIIEGKGKERKEVGCALSVYQSNWVDGVVTSKIELIRRSRSKGKIYAWDRWKLRSPSHPKLVSIAIYEAES